MKNAHEYINGILKSFFENPKKIANNEEQKRYNEMLADFNNTIERNKKFFEAYEAKRAKYLESEEE